MSRPLNNQVSCGVFISSAWMLRSLSKKPVDLILELTLALKRKIHAFEDDISKIVDMPTPTVISESLEPYLSLLLLDQKRFYPALCYLRELIKVAQGAGSQANVVCPISSSDAVVEKIFSSCLQLMDSCRASLDLFIPLSTGKTLYELSQLISEAFTAYLSRFNSTYWP